MIDAMASGETSLTIGKELILDAIADATAIAKRVLPAPPPVRSPGGHRFSRSL